MGSSLRTVVYRPHLLGEAEREKLAVELYRVHRQIFAGVEYEAFRRYVVCSPAWRTWLFIQVNEAGEQVGYLALHAFQKQVSRRRAIIFRMEAGTLPEYRGRSVALRHALAAMLAVWLRFLARPCYFFASLIHPSSYVLAARFAPQLWPRPSRPTPPDKLAVMHELADEFNLPVATASNPSVRVVNWVTREHAGDSQKTVSKNPDAAFSTLR